MLLDESLCLFQDVLDGVEGVELAQCFLECLHLRREGGGGGGTRDV